MKKVLMCCMMGVLMCGCAVFDAEKKEEESKPETTVVKPVVSEPVSPTVIEFEQGEKKAFGYIYYDLLEALEVAEENNAPVALVSCPTGCLHCIHLKMWCIEKQETLDWCEKEKIVLCYYVNNKYNSNFYKKYAGAYQSFLGSGITPYVSYGSSDDGKFVPRVRSWNGQDYFCATGMFGNVFDYVIPSESKTTWTPQVFINIISEMRK